MHKDAMEIVTNKGKFTELFKSLQKKNHMIKQMIGRGTALDELERLWEQFEQRLASFNEQIEDQKKRLREELEKRTNTVAKELDRMYEKWQENKPKERNQLNVAEAYETSKMMKKMKVDWEELD